MPPPPLLPPVSVVVEEAPGLPAVSSVLVLTLPDPFFVAARLRVVAAAATAASLAAANASCCSLGSPADYTSVSGEAPTSSALNNTSTSILISSTKDK